jgi:tetratricopeptide (TPR) repeat protein
LSNYHAANSLNQSYPTAHADLAEQYALLGQTDKAVSEANEAIRLSPDDLMIFWRYHYIAVAKFVAGDDVEAFEVSRKVVRLKPGFVRGALYLAAAAAATDKPQEATRAIYHCLSQMPELSFTNASPGFAPRYVQDRHHQRFPDMLRKAGLPA